MDRSLSSLDGGNQFYLVDAKTPSISNRVGPARTNFPPPNVIWHLGLADRIVVSGRSAWWDTLREPASYWTSRLEAGSLRRSNPDGLFCIPPRILRMSTGATELSRPWVAPSGGVRSASERQRRSAPDRTRP